MEEYLTVAQVAELLQLSEKTIYRLAQGGDPPGFKAERSWKFRRQDIDTWAAKRIGKTKKGES